MTNEIDVQLYEEFISGAIDDIPMELLEWFLENSCAAALMITNQMMYRLRETQRFFEIIRAVPSLISFIPFKRMRYYHIFRGIDEKVWTSDVVSHHLILYEDAGIVLLNAPELSVLHSLEVAEYDVVEESELRRNRILPGYGSRYGLAITADSVPDLDKLFSGPHFDSEAPIDEFTMLDFAIASGSMECFRYLLLNTPRSPSAMEIAIRAGRREMIEVLEQMEYGFEMGVKFAAAAWQNDVLRWLLETDRDRNDECILAAIKAGNRPALQIMESYELYPGSIELPELCIHMPDLANTFIRDRPASIVNEEKICRKAPLGLFTDAFFTCQLNPVRCLRGACMRKPFDSGFAELIVTRLCPDLSTIRPIFMCATEAAFQWLCSLMMNEDLDPIELCTDIHFTAFLNEGTHFLHDVEAFRFFAKSGFVARYIDTYGGSILHLLCRLGNIEVLNEAFRLQVCDIHSKNIIGQNIADYAIAMYGNNSPRAKLCSKFYYQKQ